MIMKVAQTNRKKVIRELNKILKMAYSGLPAEDYDIIKGTRNCIQILYNNEELKNAHQ